MAAHKSGLLMTRPMSKVGFLLIWPMHKSGFLMTGPMSKVGFLVIWPIIN